ncbi:hypothetical protein OAJ80_00840 [Candidatus Thioglobus sp.]|nr:hypothetical protein [Candidatus Thioglobus sp.]|tara:strand:- start:83 stop:478 length:396 start_codon:yes stop_codon:yes gene_type:complete
MSYNFKNLPKSLKKTLKTVSKNYDFKIEDCLVLTEKEGKNVVYIDFKFEQNEMMYDVFDTSLQDIISNQSSELPLVLNKVGAHLFGDNVNEYQKIYENDKGDGSWEILIENLICDDWLTVDVFLIPTDFEI